MSKQKDYGFRYFLTSEEIYFAMKKLPWVETLKRPRKLNWHGDKIETKEALKVRGKNFIFAYHCKDGDFAVREKFRFAAEGLAGMKKLMEKGGVCTEVKPD